MKAEKVSPWKAIAVLSAATLGAFLAVAGVLWLLALWLDSLLPDWGSPG